MTNRDTYHLTLRPDGKQTEAETVRNLRAALKRLLRCHRLRCVSIEKREAKP